MPIDHSALPCAASPYFYRTYSQFWLFDVSSGFEYISKRGGAVQRQSSRTVADANFPDIAVHIAGQGDALPDRTCGDAFARQYFPKGTDFSKLTKTDVQRVEDLLNNRPRKTLNYYSPNEVFAKLTDPHENYALGM